ncbi:unnamed protein product [Coccothraustes coccothraustes]
MSLALRPSPGCAEPRKPAPYTPLSLRCAGTVTSSQIQKKLFTPVPSLPGVSRRNLREGTSIEDKHDRSCRFLGGYRGPQQNRSEGLTLSRAAMGLCPCMFPF